MIDPYKTQASTNLKKARTLIERISKMIDEGKYCMDIAQQVNAATGLLKKTNNYILESHLITCGGKKLSGKVEEKEKFAKELVRICNVTSR